MTGDLRKQIESLLSVVDPRGTKGRRLIDDCDRLCARLRQLMTLNLIPPEADVEAMELACAAIYLVVRHSRGNAGKSAITLRDRTEAAAELVVSELKPPVDAMLLDRATRLLRQVPQRSPEMAEARLLADAVNLEDFGVTGLLQLTISLALTGDGVMQLMAACDRREAYGYWEARLKDGFHFEPVRQLARQRLENVRQLTSLLRQELPA